MYKYHISYFRDECDRSKRGIRDKTKNIIVTGGYNMDMDRLYQDDSPIRQFQTDIQQVFIL